MRLKTVLALLAVLGSAETAMANITSAPWGTTSKGDAAHIFTLTGAGGLSARISDFGGVLVDLHVPDRHGVPADILLGYDDLASYEKGGMFGALIGRYANRINGSQFTLDGKTYRLDHAPNATFLIHGGVTGFQKRVWSARVHDGPEPRLELTITSPDGEGGFPGTVHVTAIYTLLRDRSLKLELRATTDKPTVLNLTNHAYFNLGGEGSGDVLNQMLQVFADDYTPADALGIPTGEIAPVKDTPMDFTKPVRVGDVVDSPFAQLANRKGLDANWIVRGRPGVLRPAATVYDPASGRRMQVLTTQPGVQVYSDNVAAPTIGKGGKAYPPRASLSLETDHYPDAPNHPNFPTTEVTPDKPLHEVTVYRFSAD